MKLGLTGRIARASAARPWLTITVWTIAVAASIYAAGGLGDALTQEEKNLVTTESETAASTAERLRADAAHRQLREHQDGNADPDDHQRGPDDVHGDGPRKPQNAERQSREEVAHGLPGAAAPHHAEVTSQG